MIRLFFLIRSLETGGAERQFIELVKHLDQQRFQVTVATFYDGGALRPYWERVKGMTLVSLGKRGRWDVFGFLLRLWRAAWATGSATEKCMGAIWRWRVA